MVVFASPSVLITCSAA